MRVSISDVARRANVSISTVSRVLNRREIVNIETRERVEQAIRELGYRPNRFARGLTLGRSELVGLFLPDLHGEFYSEIIRGADQQARRMGYQLVVSSIRDADSRTSVVDAIQERAFLDGVALMISEPDDTLRALLDTTTTPIVVLDNDLPGVPHDSVLIDQERGAARLMRHLIDARGVQRVIFVGGLKTNADTRARFKAYAEALDAAGLTHRSEDVYFLDYEFESAFHLATRHAPAWAGPHTCIFAANDEMAAGVIAAASTVGVQLPQDLAVVGFDDVRIARMTHPPLTTMRVPMSQMGAQAIELLCRRLDQPERPPTRVSLQPELVVRDSCGSPVN